MKSWVFSWGQSCLTHVSLAMRPNNQVQVCPDQTIGMWLWLWLRLWHIYYIWHMAYGFMMTTVATDRTLNQDMRRPKEVSPPAPLHVSASNRMEPWHTKPKWSSEHVLWKLDSPNLKCWKKIWILLCCYAMPMSLCLCLALSMTLCHYATALRLPAMKC